jgi:hypothetical protein
VIADEDLVRQAFAVHGIHPSEEEIRFFAARYPTIRAMIESLYAIPETRYEDSALVYDAAPRFDRWGGEA